LNEQAQVSSTNVHPTPSPSAGRVLALDLGERYIGVAISDPTRTLARPLTALRRRSRRQDFAAIARLVAEQGAVLVIVGYPLSLDGGEGPQARWVADYAAALSEALPVPVQLWDERFSTVTAEELLRQGGRRRRKPGDLDAAAAAVILQSYLDAQGTGWVR